MGFQSAPSFFLAYTYRECESALMAEIFLGELSQIKFFDILKPLLTGKKTGLLAVRGKQNGEIGLEEGNIIHARTAQSTGEDALFAILSWRVGRTTFEVEISPRERTILNSTEQVLLNWSHRKQEWEKIRKVIPSGNAVFRLALLKAPEDRTIPGDHWNVLALANGMRSISEIAGALNWDEFKASKVICQLITAGLMEKAEDLTTPVKRWAGQDFFLRVETEMKKVMGPVASFVVEDKLTEWGEAKDFFPLEQAKPFVLALSEEIPNEAKRKEFIRRLTELFPRDL
jgi:hypothetical protein